MAKEAKQAKNQAQSEAKPAGQAKGRAPERARQPKGATPREQAPAVSRPAPADYRPRLKRRYLEEVVPKLRREFGIDNVMAVPRLQKVVVNIGLGEATQNIKLLDDAAAELAQLTGQRPVVTRAHKSIAAFKIRAGMAIGCRVTLRGNAMWHFLDRLISTALPRVRDFRGVPAKSFDGRGNYTLGVRDHLIFPDLEYSKVEKTKGMNITLVTSAGNDERALYLLRELGMPFMRSAA